MRYRLHTPKMTKKKKTISIDDVERIDENLALGYGARFGRNVSITMDEVIFLKKLRKAVRATDTIIDFEKKNDVYNIKWVEQVGEFVEVHDDEFEILEEEIELRAALDECLERYKIRVEKSKENTLSRVFMYGKKGDVLSECLATFKRYSRSYEIPVSLSNYEAERMLEGFAKNEELFKYAPTRILSTEVFGAFITVLLPALIAGMFIINSWLGLFGLLLPVWYFKCEKDVDYWRYYSKKVFFEDMIREFEERYGLSYSDIMESVMEESQVIVEQGLVDFIEADKKKFAGQIDEEALDRLAANYSAERDFEEFVNGKPTDKIKGLLDLIEIEEKMFAGSDKVLLKDEKPSIDMAMVNDRLQFLDWDEESASKNSFLSEILTEMNTISNRPYVGCEREILELLRLAVRYVDFTDKGVTKENLERLYLEGEFAIDKAHLKMEMARRNAVLESQSVALDEVMESEVSLQKSEGKRFALGLANKKGNGE